MLSAITTVVYLTLIPVGLALGSTTQRVVLLAVAAVLLLRLLTRHRAAVGRPTPRPAGGRAARTCTGSAAG